MTFEDFPNFQNLLAGMLTRTPDLLTEQIRKAVEPLLAQQGVDPNRITVAFDPERPSQISVGYPLPIPLDYFEITLTKTELPDPEPPLHYLELELDAETGEWKVMDPAPALELDP